MEESHPTRNTTQSILTATNEHAAMPPVKQKRITFWLSITLTFALFTFIALSLFGPNPPIEISVATTHLTTPLAADGYPDYAAVLKADMKKGVTPENNGAILFLRSMWPEYDEDFTVEDGELLCEELGMEGPPPISDRVTKFDSFENKLGALRLIQKLLPRIEKPLKEIVEQESCVTEEDEPETFTFFEEVYAEQRLSYEMLISGPQAEAINNESVDDLLWSCCPVNRPWAERDIPFLAKWIDENQAAIDRLVDAAKGPEWYLPGIVLVSGNRDSLLPLSTHSMLSMRNAARILYTRSNYHLGKQQYDLAIEDAIAIMRIAKHLAKGPFLIDQLVAIAIAGVGTEQINRVATFPSLPIKQARKLLVEIDLLPSVGRILKTMDQGERFYCLNSLMIEEGRSMEGNLFTDHTAAAEYIAQVVSSKTKVDWNIVLRKQNNFINSLLAAAKLPTWQQQQTGFDQIYSDLNAQYQENNVFWNTAQKLLTPSSRGNYLADHSVSTLNSSIAPCFFAEGRARNRLTMAKLAVALAIYRAEQGYYPEKLALLSLSILPKIPVDEYQGKPFIYRLIKTIEGKEGYLLYSSGPNGIDDAGSCSEENSHASGPQSYQGTIVDYWPAPTPEEQELFEKIPPTADDPSLRIPLRVEPWPWESIIEEYSVPE